METRITKLEDFAADTRERLARIEARLVQTATSGDIHKAISSLTWRLMTFICTFGTTLVAATYFLAKHVA